MHVNIKNISFETDHGMFSGKITVVVKNNNLVDKLMNRIKKINGIEKVSRV
jgi:GTP diphosphokinase / guanosine-3',5'-bis(diphosphate) 3'-diphosphatase